MPKYVLHDLPSEGADIIKNCFRSSIIIDAAKAYARCIGCFGCWLKTPGACIFKDGMETLGARLLTAEETVIVCRPLYGGFSVPVKRLWDRCIPGVLPFFQKRGQELHHLPRYKNHMVLKIIFYGCDGMLTAEKKLAERLAAANAVNFAAKSHSIHFLNDISELREKLK